MASRSETGTRALQRVLITGVQGFTGRYLASCLAERGYDVHGTAAGDAAAAESQVHVADLLDASALRAVIEKLRPTHVVHLAAVAFVAHGDVESMYRTNVVGTRNLLAALEDARDALRIVLVPSSANVYGNASADPIDEDVPPRPANDYAVSKLAMEHVTALWHDRLPITLVRPFNYTGVGQPMHYLVPKIVDAFRRRASQLELGNLDVERDFSDVRDVVEAYARLLEAPAGGVLNVCSGRVHSLRDVVRLASELSGHSIDVRVNPAFVRASEVKRLRGSNARLCGRIGEWTSRPLRETLAWMLAA